MKKKILLLLLTVICVMACALGLTACGENEREGNENSGSEDNTPTHTEHVYDKKVAEQKFMKSEATCTQQAVYYYSCECGEMGEDTFEYGSLAQHIFENYAPTDNATCVKNATETAKCENCDETDTREIEDTATGVHSFEDYVSDDNATCINNCTETAKCENCDETDTREIENTATGVHIFENYVSDDNATCMENATETAKCKHCDETDTREIADSKADHNYADKVCTVCGKHMPTEGLAFTLNDDKASYSCSGKGSVDDKDIVIPSEYNGKPVTAVAELAFAGNVNINSIRISEGIITVESEAFYGCTALTEVIIPDSVTSIGERVLNGCRSLISLTIPFVGDRVKTETDKHQYPLGYIFGTDSYEGGTATKQYFYANSLTCSYFDYSETYYIPATLRNVTVTGGNILCCAFYNCGTLTSITLPDNLTKINDYAFGGCRLITNLTIPDGVTRINFCAFYACNELTSITIPDSIEETGYQLFRYCDKLKYTEYGNALYLGNVNNPYLLLVQTKDSELTSCSINKKTKVIGDSAYMKCALTSLSIPDSVKVICGSAFNQCTNLTSISIGKGVKKLGTGSFYNCYNAKVTYEGDIADWCGIEGIGSSNITMRNVYINGQKLQDMTSVTISDGATVINEDAFQQCNLTSVTIPSTVISIKSGAFYFCQSLSDINFNGTIEQWNSIEKEENWDYWTGNYIVHCSDGNIGKYGYIS